MDLPDFMAAKKALSGTLDWVESGTDLILTAGIEVDGVTVEGVRFRATAVTSLPDELVVFQIEYAINGVPKPVARLEWRPKAPHNNQGLGPKELQYRPFTATHVHRFLDNWVVDKKKMRERNLPVAVPIADAKNFRAALALVKDELKILNAQKIPEPPWKPTLL